MTEKSRIKWKLDPVLQISGLDIQPFNLYWQLKKKMGAELRDDTSSSSDEENANESTQPREPDPPLPAYLSSAYEVLRRVFSYMPLEDIENASQAFRSWKPIADLTRKERRRIESFVVTETKYSMTKIWAEAKFCITFATANEMDVNRMITRYMKSTGEFCHCLSGAGIIGTVSDLSHLVQQKVRVGLSSSHRRYSFSVLRFPSLPKVGIRTYLWEEGMDFETFKKGFDIPPTETVKCVIILMITEGSVQKANMQKNDFINFLHSRQSRGFAIGGSVIDSFGNHIYRSASSSVIKYIVFYGDNVEAASTVLTADVKSLAGVNHKIKKLREVSPICEQGALFVFRCAGRQRIIRTKLSTTNITKWEGDSIRKYFPNTHIAGCFGYGEFGREYPAVEDDALPFVPLKKLKLGVWDFSFSTSLVYVGFKR